MYLSRVKLDPQNRNTLRVLASPHRMHGAVESCFPGERNRNLWRLDRLRGNLYLLIVSEEKPELSHISDQYGPDENREMLTKDYDHFLEKIENGSLWHFRLVANPTQSLMSDKKGKRGKVKACSTAEMQEKWLLDRAEKNGFAVTPESFQIAESDWKIFFKGNQKRRHRVSILQVTYEGFLRVTDAEAFRRTLVEGIGRSKAYGMGMLTVVKAG